MEVRQKTREVTNLFTQGVPRGGRIHCPQFNSSDEVIEVQEGNECV